jgi:hypothetical protein
LFRDTPVDVPTPNVLALQIQPEEGISLLESWQWRNERL